MSPYAPHSRVAWKWCSAPTRCHQRAATATSTNWHWPLPAWQRRGLARERAKRANQCGSVFFAGKRRMANRDASEGGRFMSQRGRHVVITDERHQLPYSKGLMASSIMATGLTPARAFHVAEVIEERLDEGGRASISQSELTELALTVLRKEVGDRYAESFAKWQMVNRLE